MEAEADLAAAQDHELWTHDGVMETNRFLLALYLDRSVDVTNFRVFMEQGLGDLDIPLIIYRGS